MMPSVSVSPPAIVRSSLEEMLDSLCKRDGQPNDVPPALPTRPVSRGRRPSSRRSLPISSKVVASKNSQEFLCNGSAKKLVERLNGSTKSGKDEGFRSGIFGSKRFRKEQPDESPYVGLLELENSERMQDSGDSDSTPGPSPSGGPSPEGFTWADTAGYALKKKLRVWCLLPTGEWKLGRIQSITGDDANVLLSDGKVLTVSTENLLPANPDILDGVDDLIQLSYLNEPSVLHNLQHRYSKDTIYTKAGPVLVAINPFKDVPIYGSGFLTAYRQKMMDKPHVYVIADNAFNEMMNGGVTQSIIISGESGAGKTETAKVAMQYLASLGGGIGIESEVLQTNYILEAFGNAKTSRNDNSSRFGKVIEIHFSEVGKICGAKIQTFLLEKSRVVQRARGERSYHIFYQLCAGAPSPLRERLYLKTAKDYEYLKQSECMTIDNIDDAQRFHLLMEALDIVQIHKEDQEKAFALLAAVLWLGNISFKIIDNENHVEVVKDEGVTVAARLLDCSEKSLILALSTRKIKAGKDNIVQKLALAQAVDTRDALAKSIYSSLFDWLVEQINKLLVVGKSSEAGKLCSGRSISILDIYGFESFPKNGFEQFCINYANERLQQHFNRHLFKLEQEEYVQDGIDWTKVDFVDNAECLNLFEKKPIGLLSLLDEESTFPRATDLTFANKLKQHLSGYPCFKGERGGAFSVCHYAGEVLYDTSCFLEKNRDPLHSESIQLLLSSNSELPKLFAYNMINHSQKQAVSSGACNVADSQKQSVGMKFKGQLFKLMQRLESTTPHFIRCIKPNSKQLHGIYEQDLVLQQLRCCGVLEVVRIARSGFPTRMTHQQFAERYGCLLLETGAPQDPLSVSVAVLQHCGVLPDMYQVGYTKLFFRTGQIAALEESRNRMLHGIIRVQKCYHGRRARHHFLELRRGATMLQSFIRRERARSEFKLTVNRRRAIIVIQKHAKRLIVQKAYDRWRKAAIHVQCVVRGCLARKQFEVLNSLDLLKQKRITVYNKEVNSTMDVKDRGRENPSINLSIIAELQKRILKAEATVRQKEEENGSLLLQLKQYEAKWSDYEAKMRSMEETWQLQMTALQSSLASARRRLSPDDTPRVPTNGGRHDISPLHTGRIDVSTTPVLHYDSEDALSLGTQTPDVTPAKPARPTESAPGRVTESGHVAVTRLVKEFDQRREVFEDDARFAIEVKPQGSIYDASPDEELRKLKIRFRAWKKEYKARLRETKLMLHKLGHGEAEKFRKKWWGKISARGS